MIEYELDKETAILHVRPIGPLRKEDFDRLAAEVDPFIDQTGNLAGFILEVKQFPGWESLGAAIRHFRFVHDHHKRVSKVAVVTDSRLGGLAEHVAAHFTTAKIRHFPANQFDAAKAWIRESVDSE